MIKAIIFDFGNVISTFNNKLFLEKISKHSDKSIDDLNRIIYSESNLPKKYETGKISSDDFFDEIVNECALNISREDFIEAYTNIFSPIDSTFELIKKLNESYRIALLSNTSEWDFVYGIKKISVFDLFEKITLSFEVGEMKPNEKIFEDSLKKLGLKPEECVYIDDVKEYADKAIKLGMFGVNYISYEKLLQDLRKIGVCI